MTLTSETKLYQIYIISAVSRVLAMVHFELHQPEKSLLKTELVKESGNNDSW